MICLGWSRSKGGKGWQGDQLSIFSPWTWSICFESTLLIFLLEAICNLEGYLYYSASCAGSGCCWGRWVRKSCQVRMVLRQMSEGVLPGFPFKAIVLVRHHHYWCYNYHLHQWCWSLSWSSLLLGVKSNQMTIETNQVAEGRMEKPNNAKATYYLENETYVKYMPFPPNCRLGFHFF